MSPEKTVDEVVRRFLDEKLDIIKREYNPTHLIVLAHVLKAMAGKRAT